MTSPAPTPVPSIDAAHVIETMGWTVQPDGTYLGPEGCRYPASFPELMAMYLREQQRIAAAAAALVSSGAAAGGRREIPMIKREDIIAEVLRDRPAMESAIRLLEEKVLRRRCDSDGVNCCIRCNTNFVVARMKDLLALAAAPAPAAEGRDAP